MGPETTFFSYARSDSDFALKLARDLRQAGADVWLDQLDIKAGSRWDLSVETALMNSSKMVVILSPDSVASDNVMDEVSFALEERKTIIPLLFKTCNIPLRLRRLQRADFTKNYGEGFENLLLALNLEKLISGLPGKDDSRPAIKAAQESEFDENKNNYEKIRAEAEAKSLEEERKLKEQAESERLEEERKLKEQAEAKRQEEQRKLKEQVEAKRLEDERKLKEQKETEKKEKERELWEQEKAKREAETKYKEQAKLVKIDNKSKTNAEASNLIKNTYKIPILIAGIFAILVIVLWIVNSGRNDKRYQIYTEQLSGNPVDTASEFQDWGYALSVNSIDGYKTYQQNFQNGSHFKEAQTRIDKIVDSNDWESAQSFGTKYAYQEYLQKHTNGTWAWAANQKIIDLDKTPKLEPSDETTENAESYFWNSMKSFNTVKSYQTYQDLYPNGQYYSEATRQITAIKKAVKPAIGKEYQGGIIFYVDASGQHGLIAAPFDQGKAIWADSDTITGASGREIGTGKRNTDILVAKLGEGNYAAKLCADLVLNGYDDWFLPSKDELNQLYLNKDNVGDFIEYEEFEGGHLRMFGFFYWSSSEEEDNHFDNTTAWTQNFHFGDQDNFDKGAPGEVRAVRAF